MRRARLLEMTPFALTLALVCHRTIYGFDAVSVAAWASALVMLFVICVGAVRALVRRRPREILGLWYIPCLFAPVSVLYPWATVPSHVGLGMGDLATFVNFAEGHPMMRTRVLLGAGCVLGAGAMPVAFAMGVRRWQLPWTGRLGLFVLALVPWAPTFLVLDREMLVTSLYLFPALAMFAAGPFVRALAVVSMLLGTILGAPRPALARRPPPNHREGEPDS